MRCCFFSTEGCNSFYLSVCSGSWGSVLTLLLAQDRMWWCSKSVHGDGPTEHHLQFTFLWLFLLDQLGEVGRRLGAWGLQPARRKMSVAVVRRGNEAGTTATMIYVLTLLWNKTIHDFSPFVSVQHCAVYIMGYCSPEQGWTTCCDRQPEEQAALLHPLPALSVQDSAQL